MKNERYLAHLDTTVVHVSIISLDALNFVIY